MTNYFLFYFEPHVKALNAFQSWRVFTVEVLQADRPVRVAVVIKKVCEVEEGDFCIGSCFVANKYRDFSPMGCFKPN